MTPAEARERVARVKAEADRGDHEGAHVEQDSLRADVLKYLAEVAPAELGVLAKIALSTDDIEFHRWYA